MADVYFGSVYRIDKQMTTVAVSKTTGEYPASPFNPSEAYPEYPFRESDIAHEINSVYQSVRNNFYLLGYDLANYGKPEWNPLKEIVLPGTTVFIKPNLVDHQHRHGGNIWSVITHPSVIRAVADYVAIALKGRGKIMIGDNPHVDADFDKIKSICCLEELKLFYKSNFGIDCEIVDCRTWHTPDLKYYGFKDGRKRLSGDSLGEISIDIGSHSLLSNKTALLFRGTYNERMETILNHILGKHRYVFSKSIFSADTYISIPKLKTHAKVGVTLNIKGLVGTIANKNSLVHWCIGFPLLGGDEYPSPKKKIDYLKLYWQHFIFGIIPSKIYFYLRNLLNKTLIGIWYNKVISTEAQKAKMLRGAFPSNDTTWRMTVDVYNAFIGDVAESRKANNLKRRYLSVIDGVIGGDIDGPHSPHERCANVIISGDDLLAVDLVATRLMDFDISKVRYLQHLLDAELQNELEGIKVISNEFETKSFFDTQKRFLMFSPPHLWPKLSLMNTQGG